MTRAAGWMLAAALLNASVGCGGPAGTAGQQGAPGPEGPPGEAGPAFTAEPSVSAVRPSQMALARTVEVQVAAFATEWTKGSAPEVDFGPGITVKSVSVASDTLLVVTAEADTQAATGRRNLTVSHGGKVLTFNGGFSLRAPLEVVSAPASLGRPGVGGIEVQVVDPELGVPESADAIAFETPDGIHAGVAALEETRVLFWVGADLAALTGTYELAIRFYPDEARERVVTVPVTILDETLATWAQGTNSSAVPANGSLAATLTVETLSQVSLTVSASEGRAPDLYVLGGTGSFSDVVAEPGAAYFFAEPEQTYYLIAWERGGSDAAFTVELDAARTSPDVSDAEPNDTAAQAQVIPLLPSVVSGQFSSSSDSDWYKVTLSGAHVGKHLVANYQSGNADMAVEVRAADGTTVLGTSPEIYGSSWQGPQVTQAGTYYFRIHCPYWSGSYSIQLALQ